jgi:hypothetical protein
MDALIAQMGKLGRREAFAAVEAAFGAIKACPAPSATEVNGFINLVHLVLLIYPRGMRIRVSGARQTANPHEVVLQFNDTYEAALDRTVDFLSRNFLGHIEKYAPRQYLRAALRALAKEYGNERATGNETVTVDELSPAADSEPAQDERPSYLKRYEYIGQDKSDGEIFYDWYVGSLSRRELAQLHGISVEQVNRVLLEVARERFEQGRFYPMVSWLVGMNVNGDVLWLWSKGLSPQQIADKVGKSRWVVYKRLEGIRLLMARLRARGEPGRAFGRWLCGIEPELYRRRDVRGILREFDSKLELSESLG